MSTSSEVGILLEQLAAAKQRIRQLEHQSLQQWEQRESTQDDHGYADDDDDSFLRPATVAEIPATHGDDEDDDAFLVPTYAAPSSTEVGTNHVSLGIANQNAIVEEIEREALHWKDRCQDLEDQRSMELAREQAWRTSCGHAMRSLLQLAFELQGDPQEVFGEWHRRRSSLSLQSSPSVVKMVESSVLEFLEDSVVRPITLTLVSNHNGTPSPPPRRRDGSGPCRGYREDIVRSDNDDDKERYGDTQTPNRDSILLDSHRVGGASSARALRRSRQQQSAASVVARIGAEHGQTPKLRAPNSSSVLITSPPGGVDVFQLLCRKHRDAAMCARNKWLHQLAAFSRTTTLRQTFLVWSRFAEQRRALRSAGRSYRRHVCRAALHLLEARHVIHGILGPAWRQWCLVAQSRRLSRQVHRMMLQYATHGMLIGNMIRNQNELWNGFVSDAAAILDQQISDLEVLRDDVHYIAGERYPRRDDMSALM